MRVARLIQREKNKTSVNDADEGRPMIGREFPHMAKPLQASLRSPVLDFFSEGQSALFWPVCLYCWPASQRQ